MPYSDIVPIVDTRIPTILSFDIDSNSLIIGDSARLTGFQGKTTVFNFKHYLGDNDTIFNKKNVGLWINIPNLSGSSAGLTKTFSPKEATTEYLRLLLKNIKLPEFIYIGEPAIIDEKWRDNFRRHMRDVFSELKLNTIIKYFPEPFAVFQYYRHFLKLFTLIKSAENVLVLDIGGGTFNSAIIRTTEEGSLAFGGPLSIPIGLQADQCGGSAIDRELLKVCVEKAKLGGIKWKEDPIIRADNKKIPLLYVEDAKIKLSKRMGIKAKFTEDQSHVVERICFSPDSLHPTQQVDTFLTGEDLKNVVHKMWSSKYGDIVIKTIGEAKDKLSKSSIKYDGIDKVLMAGGSSLLPYMKDEIIRVLPTQIKYDEVYIGSDSGNAVAFGIACECIHQSRREPKLSVGSIAPCILNDLHIGFKKSRKSNIYWPKVSANGIKLKNGQLISSPFETSGLDLQFDIELPFDIEDKLFYYFYDEEVDSTRIDDPLNINDYVIAVPSENRYSKKIILNLIIEINGKIKPIFIFRPKKKITEKDYIKIEGHEFFIGNLNIKEGDSYIGLDFGTSNSYLAKLLKPKKEISSSLYPEFSFSPSTKDKLRLLEIKIRNYVEDGIFKEDSIMEFAGNQMLPIVFHSNKIEGNPLTKGETEEIIYKTDNSNLSAHQREAYNLEGAYTWVIENCNISVTDPESFIRRINKMILEGVKKGGGIYRNKDVKISGTTFNTTSIVNIPIFMNKLSEEIKNYSKDRSIIELVADIHAKIVSIHPFIDGNGRTARLYVNAVLLANNLPVIVVNSDDRNRYLDALGETNNGDISPLIELHIEYLLEQIENYKLQENIIEEESHENNVVDGSIEVNKHLTVYDGQILSVEDKYVQALSLENDPLEYIMEEKIKEQNESIEREYGKWNTAMLEFLEEFKSITRKFNNNEKYRNAGYWINIREYDMLSVDKYRDMVHGKKVSRTWFFGFEIKRGTLNKVRFILFFQHGSHTYWSDNCNITIGMARKTEQGFQKLMSEPISIREIGIKNGFITFLSKEATIIDGGTTKTINTLIAQIIRAML